MNCWEYQEQIAAAARRGQAIAEIMEAGGADHLARCRACREFAAQMAEVAGPLADYRALVQEAALDPMVSAADRARAALIERLAAAAGQPPSRPAASFIAWVNRLSLERARRVVCEYPAATAGFAVCLAAVFGLLHWSQGQARWPSTGSVTAPRSGLDRQPQGMASRPAASAARPAETGQGDGAIVAALPSKSKSKSMSRPDRTLTPTPTPTRSVRPVAPSPPRPVALLPHPLRHPAPTGGDDLTNLNGDLVVGKPRWAAVPGDEWMAVEAGLDRLAPRGDDFVQIPFPRLASTSDRQLVAAVERYRDEGGWDPTLLPLPSAHSRPLVAALEQYKREAGIVDPRLAHAVTVQQKATALSDLCERLRADTGIQLVAGRSVADEKVTLFCQKVPLRDVMRQLSRPFGYTWLRSGKAGEYKYELTQDLRSQLLEEELRSKDRNAALIALDREMSQYRPFLGLTPEQARARAKTASALEKPAMEGLAGPGWGAIQMYFRLSPNDMAALRAGEPLRFSPNPGPGEYPLPPEVARGVLQSLPPERGPAGPPRQGGAAPGQRVVLEEDVRVQGPPGAAAPGTGAETQPEVHLEIQPSELGQFLLMGGSGVTVTGPQGSRRQMSRSNLATGESPTVRSPQNARLNAKLARDPALKARVSVRPEASCGADPSPGPSPARRGGTAASGSPERREGSGARSHGPKATSADVLEAVHRATGLPIVADYYTRLYDPAALTVQNRPVFEAVNQLADRMRLRWNKEGEWLQFRSVSYFHDRLKEVPNRLLNRWSAARREHGGLRLEDLLEIAQLSDPQLDAGSMAEGARLCFGLVEWDLARGRGARPHLRYLASFTSEQRQTIRSAAGLPFTRMSLAQQQQFIALAFGAQAGELQSLEELTGAALRVDYSLPGQFEWRGGEGATGRRGDGAAGGAGADAGGSAAGGAAARSASGTGADRALRAGADDPVYDRRSRGTLAAVGNSRDAGRHECDGAPGGGAKGRTVGPHPLAPSPNDWARGNTSGSLVRHPSPSCWERGRG